MTTSISPTNSSIGTGHQSCPVWGSEGLSGVDGFGGFGSSGSAVFVITKVIPFRSTRTV